jgi:hypothetical protein
VLSQLGRDIGEYAAVLALIVTSWMTTIFEAKVEKWAIVMAQAGGF